MKNHCKLTLAAKTCASPGDGEASLTRVNVESLLLAMEDIIVTKLSAQLSVDRATTMPCYCQGSGGYNLNQKEGSFCSAGKKQPPPSFVT